VDAGSGRGDAGEKEGGAVKILVLWCLTLIMPPHPSVATPERPLCSFDDEHNCRGFVPMLVREGWEGTTSYQCRIRHQFFVPGASGKHPEFSAR
jgi:hypothetical protein